MRLQWHPKAIQEILQIENQVQKYLNKHIEKLPEEGLNLEKVGRVKREKIGLNAYKLKLNPEEKEKINHRIIFHVNDDNNYKIVKLGKRPDFYNLENLKEAKNRI